MIYPKEIESLGLRHKDAARFWRDMGSHENLDTLPEDLDCWYRIICLTSTSASTAQGSWSRDTQGIYVKTNWKKKENCKM